MKHFCSTCNYEIEGIQEAARIILEGCPRCTGKKITKHKINNIKMFDDTLNQNISIVMKNKGEYVFNLKTLTERTEDEPIIIADSNGKINIFFEDT